MIVSGFTAALELDTYPLRNLIRPRCAERAKSGRGKPVLIMHIDFLACFHAISLERSRFSKIATLLGERERAHLVPSLTTGARRLYKLYIIGRAGASPPSRTAAIIFLYNYI